MYSGSVGIGASTIGVGVVAGSVVNGSLPATGAATFIWALLAMILIFGGLILLRLAAVRRANEAITDDARTLGLQAALGLDADGLAETTDDTGTERVE